MTHTQITDTQIEQLRTEAAEHGDLAQVLICDIALGAEEPIDSPEAYEERCGGGGLEEHECRVLMAADSVEAARALCAEALSDALAEEVSL